MSGVVELLPRAPAKVEHGCDYDMAVYQMD